MLSHIIKHRANDLGILKEHPERDVAFVTKQATVLSGRMIVIVREPDSVTTSNAGLRLFTNRASAVLGRQQGLVTALMRNAGSTYVMPTLIAFAATLGAMTVNVPANDRIVMAMLAMCFGVWWSRYVSIVIALSAEFAQVLQVIFAVLARPFEPTSSTVPIRHLANFGNQVFTAPTARGIGAIVTASLCTHNGEYRYVT